MRRHVAGRAWVVIVAPGAADFISLFENEEILNTGLSQLDGQAQPAKPGANDQHAQRRGRSGIVMHCCSPQNPCTAGGSMRLNSQYGGKGLRPVSASQHCCAALLYNGAIRYQLAATHASDWLAEKTAPACRNGAPEQVAKPPHRFAV